MDIFNHYYDKFDVFVVGQCDHFNKGLDNTESREYSTADALRSIQTRAALVFAFLVHLPLSHVHSCFTFASGIAIVFLNIRTKYWIYQRANDLVCFIYDTILK
jgi:hypothetical protein